MTEVNSVRAVPVEAAQQEGAVVETAAKTVSKSKIERLPWLYHRGQKIETMSDRQLRGALRGIARSESKKLPREQDEKGKRDKGALIDVGLATILEIMLDSHSRGKVLSPRQ